MVLNTPAIQSYLTLDFLSWFLVSLASLCSGVVAGFALFVDLSAPAEVAAACVLGYVALAAPAIYLDRRARARLYAATGFSSLRFYLMAEGGDGE
ncbi:MAG: hypothetical protein WC343_02945 [Bacilli bacterium]|jgi:hypothetical protein